MNRSSICKSVVAGVATAVLLTGAACAYAEDWSDDDGGYSSYHQGWADYYRRRNFRVDVLT